MQHLETDTGSSGQWFGKEETTTSVHVPLKIGIGVSHNSGISISKDNPVSCVQAGGNGNMSSALTS